MASVNTSAQGQAVMESASEDYDITAERAVLERELEGSAVIDDLTSLIDVEDFQSILQFGAGATASLSRASDSILRSMSIVGVSESNQLLTELSSIMDKFDINEVTKEPGVFGKFGNRFEKTVEKYNNMGQAVDRVYIRLKSFEAEIRKSNESLHKLFEANVECYRELVKYIVAAEEACREIDYYIEVRERELEATKDSNIELELVTVKQAQKMMEQRTHDLKLAEIVALQSIPMIKTMEASNYNLMRKIDSAFIVTLPVFKQALAQAILLKRQKLQADALAELDKKTKELMKRNAENAAELARMNPQLAAENERMETLRATWQTIHDGIAETKQLEANANKARTADKERLEQLRKDFEQSQKA